MASARNIRAAPHRRVHAPPCGGDGRVAAAPPGTPQARARTGGHAGGAAHSTEPLLVQCNRWGGATRRPACSPNTGVRCAGRTPPTSARHMGQDATAMACRGAGSVSGAGPDPGEAGQGLTHSCAMVPGERRLPCPLRSCPGSNLNGGLRSDWSVGGDSGVSV